MIHRNTRRAARCFLPLILCAFGACPDGDDRPGDPQPADPNDTPSVPPSTNVTTTAANPPDDSRTSESVDTYDTDMNLGAGGEGGIGGSGNLP